MQPSRSSAAIISISAMLLIATITSPVFAASTPTKTTWWKPTAARPLQLHWMIDGALNLTDKRQMGLVNLDGTALPPPDVYDIDGELNSKATVTALHAQGKKVICYFDAGVYESYRSDAKKFPKSVIGSKDVGWDNSYWLDIRQIKVLEPIMKARMQTCKNKGFDAIEPDEVVWDPTNKTGFPLSYQEVLTYSRSLATWAHSMGMSIGQKDNPAQTADLVNYYDWNLNEQCYQYDECTSVDINGRSVKNLQLYVQKNKAVFIVEYNGSGQLNPSTAKWSQICAKSKASHFNTTLFPLELNGGRKPCTTKSTW